jgi:hypothetical protein
MGLVRRRQKTTPDDSLQSPPARRIKSSQVPVDSVQPNLSSGYLPESLTRCVETEIPPTSGSLNNRCQVVDHKVASANHSSSGPS